MTKEELRDKDQAVLQAIQNGHDDVQKITSKTTLENHEVNYSLQKLEDLELIQIQKPDGYTTRTINGQKRVFQHPKQAQLTDKGQQTLKQESREELDQYEHLSRKELVKKTHELEIQIEELEKSFKIFKKQIQDRI